MSLQSPTVPQTSGQQRNPIVLVGASVRAAAESARRAGLDVFAIDLFGDLQTRQAARAWIPMSRLLDDLSPTSPGKPPVAHPWLAVLQQLVSRSGLDRDALQGSRPWSLSIISRWPGCEVLMAPLVDHGGEWRQRFRDLHPEGSHAPQLIGATLEQQTLAQSPPFVADLARRSGVKTPGTKTSGPVPRGWLVKPFHRTGGLGVQYAESETLPENTFCQTTVAGKACGATFVSDGRECKLLGICRALHKRMGKRPFVYAGALGPVSVSPDCWQSVERIGQQLVELTGLAGPLNVDFILSGTEIFLLECNPRYSGSMELIETAWRQHIGLPCSVFEPFARWQQRVATHGPVPIEQLGVKYVVFAKQPSVVQPQQFDTVRLDGALSDRFQWTDVPFEATQLDVGDPIATVIGRLPIEHSMRGALSQVLRVSP